MNDPVSGDRAVSVASLTVVGVTIVLVVMLARVAQLQIAPGARLAAFVSDRVTSLPEQAPRGDIGDSRGRLLASTRSMSPAPASR